MVRRLMDIYNNKSTDIAQDIYDSFNKFIFSNDRNIFNKLYSKFIFYNKTKNLNGDIVECGVFKGSGLLSWLKILALNEPNTIKKVIGFDYFGSDFVSKLNSDLDKQMMGQVFDRCKSELNISKQDISNLVTSAGFDISKFELIEGNICDTAHDFVNNRPGFRISILNLDLDLEEPTLAALENFWPRVVSGGIIILDEYGYHVWTESNAVDYFIKNNNCTLYRSTMKAPSAFIIKN
jgi:hypothetical protein